MIISYKYKYIYIDIPKTGCTSIQYYLLENDKTCEKNCVEVKGEKIKIDSHTKTKDLKQIMGKEFDKYTVFTFIRDPFSRRVSGYFFYKNGNTMRSHYFTRNFMARLNIILTKIFPFLIWSIIKPQKKIVDYFFDDKNNLLIDLVGKTGSMNKDLSSISKLIGIPLNGKNVSFKNRSNHLSADSYYSNKLHKKIYSKLIKRDIELYKQYKNRIITEKYHLNTF